MSDPKDVGNRYVRMVMDDMVAEGSLTTKQVNRCMELYEQLKKENPGMFEDGPIDGGRVHVKRS